MSGDDTGEDSPDETALEDPDEDALVERVDGAEEALAAAKTESDLDDVEARLADVEARLDDATLPVPDDDEDDQAPADRIESRLSELRDRLEAERGPYLRAVTEALEDREETITDAEWTEAGQQEVVQAVEAFLASLGEIDGVTAGTDVTVDDDGPAAIATAVNSVRTTLAERQLDPDDDAETIEALLDASETLAEGLETAEVWDDLTIREQLDAEGFYDVLDAKNRKDFPPEWNAVKLYEKAGEIEPILTVLERFESDFMEDNALDALEHVAPVEAFDAVHQLAQRRNKQAVRILGRIGDERACDTLEDFLGGGDTKLELETLQALGMIGDEESTQAVANRLVADSAEVRSVAARALGLIGDTRAIEPLADVLADDEADEVRASAAWALVAIGTQRALDEAAQYADDRSYLVQAEAEKAVST
jgi:hypothetical protein